MRAPHKCPVCEGRGTVQRGFYDALQGLFGPERESCRACVGTGVLWSEQKITLKAEPVRLPIPEEPPVIVPPAQQPFLPRPSRTSDPYPMPPPIMCEDTHA